MAPDVMAVVLCAALLHAGWNALVRSSQDTLRDTVLIVAGAGLWALCLLPALPAPAAASLPWLAASVAIHVAYFLLVARAYRHGELALAYPLMRGSAPLMTAVAASALLGETLPPGGWVATLLIAAGILLLGLDARRRGHAAPGVLRTALCNGGVVALYTLVDGQGVRLSGSAFAYTGWMFVGTAVLLGIVLWRLRRPALPVLLRSGGRRLLLGGAGTLGSYALALWAMTRAPVALVAALRETSVVFGLLIATCVLKEPVTRVRVAAILTVAAGAVALRLAPA